VHQDDLCSVVVDIRPVNPGHILVMPNRHAASLAELRDEEAARMFELGLHMAAAIRASDLRCEGIDLFLADGAAAGQEVFHSHLHVFPRYAGDGFGFRFGPHYQRVARGEMDTVAATLRAALATIDPARGND
jgi:histidine triad (HIT) family protein